jgi:CRISPR-associated protein Cas2
MLVILTYDVNEKNHKVFRICSEYLVHRLNSVFEGRLTPALLTQLKGRLKKALGEGDSLIIYEFDSLKHSRKSILGKKENSGNLLL